MRRMNADVRYIGLVACVVATLVVACDRGNDPSSAPQLDASSPAMPEHAGEPRPQQEEASIDPALLPDSTDQMFERLSSADRAVVEGFYRNYGDSVMTFNNKEELLWLIRHGYPMPTDVLEAAAQSDDELEARYNAGEIMAGYFLLDRKAAAAAESAPDLTSRWQTDLFTQELLARGGPFAGYAYFRYHSQLEGSRHAALAGLLWADWQGDYRAGSELMDQVGDGAQYRDEDIPGPASVALAYQALLGSMRVKNPAVLTRKIDPLIGYRTAPGR